MAKPRQSAAAKHRRFLRQAAKGYDELLAAQGGHCALCPATGGTRRLSIDHDHATMTVRGVLCHRCNRAIPSWATPEFFRAAAAYLERSLERTAA